MKAELLRAVAIANDDGEFKVAARMWNADVDFADGEDSVRIVVRDGVLSAAPAAGKTAAEIRVAGPAEGWSAMLEPVPPPFYQDLFGATLHHGFSLTGDLESAWAYYPALRRLIELMRRSSAEVA